MPYTRQYRTVIPLEAGGDADVMRWLAREACERKAAGDCLRVTDWREDRLTPDAIPPKVGKQLGRPITDFEWFAFTATAVAVTSA